jgi:lysozyme
MTDQGKLTPSLANRLAPEWASFPTHSGGSYYGQPVKRFSELQKFYQENLENLRNSVKQQEKENA